MNGNLTMSLDKLKEAVEKGNDSKDRLLKTTNAMTAELEELLTFVDITSLNSKIVQLRDNTSNLTGLVVKNFDNLNEFLNTQISNYGQLGEDAADAASSLNSNF